MIRLSPWLILGLSATLPAMANEVNFNQPGGGPIEIRTQSPIQSLRYAAKIDDPRQKKDGFTSYSIHVNAASIWTQSAEYEMDYYTFDYQLEWERHWHYGWKTELSLSQRNTNDARLDQLTITFHKLFGVGQNGRTKVPKHRYVYKFKNLDIEEVKFENQTFSRAIELLVAKNIYQDEKQSLSLGVTGHYESNDRHPGWDCAFKVGYYYAINQDHQLYASLDYSRFHSASFFNIPLKKQLATLSISYEYQTEPDRSWHIQYLLNDGATIGLGELGKPSHELLIGHRWTVNRHRYEFALIENLVNPDNSADISISLTYKFTPRLL